MKVNDIIKEIKSDADNRRLPCWKDVLVEEIEKLRAIIKDARSARKRKGGYSGGGNPIFWYDTDLMEKALVGLGPAFLKLHEKTLKDDEDES